jgi:glycosyltransferase involved in cell wall biosynthesis
MSLQPVLFIAYNFPPHGGPGIQRSAKFVKYLPEYGWKPIVITTMEDVSPVKDTSLLEDIGSEVPVIRIPGFNIYRLIEGAAKYRLRLPAVMLNLVLQIPDAGIFWSRRVRTFIPEIIDRYKPKVIYTTSGPYSSHLLGAWVKKRYSIPWLADFRDPWSNNLVVPYLPGYRWINRRLEYKVLGLADSVTSVSEPWLDKLRKNLGTDIEKFITLPNGYDEADIQPYPFPSKSSPFIITYLGSFYRNQRPESFIRAVKALIEQGRIPEKGIQFRFIGKNAKSLIPDGLPFVTYDYMPHNKLNRFRLETHALLLILNTSPKNVGTPSGKLYEYIASNRPIIGIVPPGGVAQKLIEETRTGYTTDSDPSTIADTIENLYTQWKNGILNWNPNWIEIKHYTRRNLTKQLADQFDQLTHNMEVLS